MCRAKRAATHYRMDASRTVAIEPAIEPAIEAECSVESNAIDLARDAVRERLAARRVCSDRRMRTDLEFFLLNHFGTALVAALCETIVATVIADGVGTSGSTAAVAVMRLDRLEREVRATDALSVRGLTAFRVSHDKYSERLRGVVVEFARRIRAVSAAGGAAEWSGELTMYGASPEAEGG